jgi:hypothetical protein
MDDTVLPLPLGIGMLELPNGAGALLAGVTVLLAAARVEFPG